MVAHVFAGNAAVAYAAFNLRDDYYREMARYVINAGLARKGLSSVDTVIDCGAGIGISTMELLKNARRVYAVEPQDGMRAVLQMNVMGDPRVIVLPGRAEESLDGLVSVYDVVSHEILTPIKVDLITCCQMFHLLNAPGKESLIPAALRNLKNHLVRGGTLAFDLGPSNFQFKLPLTDHRSGKEGSGEIITELAHPLYQRAHELVLKIVKREFPRFDRENLWPPMASRMTLPFLEGELKDAGFDHVHVEEILSPVSGARVVNFIRNGWTVFFRWEPLNELPSERKLALMSEAMGELFKSRDFAKMQMVMSYHPTAVITAVSQ